MVRGRSGSRTSPPVPINRSQQQHADLSYYRVYSRPRSLTKHCVVLDFDDTLISSFDDMELLDKMGIMSDPELIELRRKVFVRSMNDSLESRGSGVASQFWGIYRPHLREFIRWCFRYFARVMCWTAGQPRYATAIADAIFQDTPSPDVLYDSRMVIEVADEGDDDMLNFTKPLVNLFVNERLDGIASLRNTFLIDDRPDNSMTNPHNAIILPPFEPSPTLQTLLSMDQEDVALRQIMDWCMRSEVMNCKDVRTLDKSGIFEQPVVPSSKARQRELTRHQLARRR